MKLAIPTRDNNVDDHFGHCAYYTIFSIDGGCVTSREVLPSPQGCGCKSNIASVLADLGVSLMLAGSMGQGAKNVLEGHLIEVIRGCSGSVDELVGLYLSGKLLDSGLGCSSHDGDHVCSGSK
ncbi:MAG: NifB/NifX family molybdenum-iron cluster-binding protein [Mucinivorans sp.]